MTKLLEKEFNYQEKYFDIKAELDSIKDDIQIYKSIINKLNKNNYDICELYKQTAFELKHKIPLSKYAKTKRKFEGLSMREYSKQHGGSKSQICKYESGYYDNKVSPSVAKSFCKIYDITYDNFINNFKYNDFHRIVHKLVIKEEK